MEITEIATSDDYEDTYDNHVYPKIEVFVEFKTVESDGFIKIYIFSRAGKILSKLDDWYNIRNLRDDWVIDLNWKIVDKWKQFSHEEVLVTSHKNFSEFEVTNAKLGELNKCKIDNLYDLVANEKQKLVTLS